MHMLHEKYWHAVHVMQIYNLKDDKKSHNYIIPNIFHAHKQ